MKQDREKGTESSTDTTLDSVFRNLVLQSPVSTWIADRSGTLIFQNAANAKLFGIESDEQVVGKYNIFQDNEVRRLGLLPDVQRVFDEGVSFEALAEYDFGRVEHVTVPHAPGKKTLRVFLFAITDESGQVKYVVVQHEDYTEKRMTEEALREQRDRAQKYLDVAGVVLVVLESDGVVSLINKKGCNLLGYSEEEIIGKNWFDNFIPKNVVPSVKDVHDKLMAGEVEPVESFENPILTKTGEERLILWHNTVLRDEEGRITATLSSGEDITERRQYEDNLRYRLEFEKLIATISTRFITLAPEEVDGGIGDTLRQLGTFAGVDRSYVFLFSNAGKLMSNTHEWVAEGIEPHIQDLQNLQTDLYRWAIERLSRFEILHVARVADLPPEARNEKDVFESEGIQSLINVPIVFEGSLIGFVGFDSVREEKAWAEDDISLLRIVGEILANALVRKKSQQAIEASEQNFRALFRYAPAGVFAYDRQGVILQANLQCERIWGYPLAQLLGRTIFETIADPGEDRAITRKIISRVFSGETVEDLEFRNRSADNTTVYVLTSTTPVYGSAGEITMGISLNVDITDRKLAEQRSSELMEQQTQFYRQTILSATGGKLEICRREEIERITGSIVEKYEIFKPADITATRHRIKQLMIAKGMPVERAENLSLCVGEATTNALKHAGGGKVALMTQDSRVMVRVSDEGSGMDALILPRVILERGYSTGGSLGMGYALILTLADQVCLCTGPYGTTVVIEMELEARVEVPSIEALPDTW